MQIQVLVEDVGRDDSTGTEAGVEAAVSVVAHNRKVRGTAAGTLAGATHQNLSVTLERDCLSLVSAGDVCRNDPVGTEAGVEAAVSVVAHNGNVRAAGSCHHDLAVGLHGCFLC